MRFHAAHWAKRYRVTPGRTAHEGTIMAKSQKKSNKEVRKPKAEKPPKQNASQPTLKTGVVKGLENMKR